MYVSRKQLLDLADYDLNQFKNLQHRNQLPTFEMNANSDERGYQAGNAVMLVVGEAVAQATRISRDDIRIMCQFHGPEIMNALHEKSQGKPVMMGVVTAVGGQMVFAFGALSELLEGVVSEKGEVNSELEAYTIINIDQKLGAVLDRLNAAGIDLLKKEWVE